MKYLSSFEKLLNKKKKSDPYKLISDFDFSFSWISIFDNSSSE